MNNDNPPPENPGPAPVYNIVPAHIPLNEILAHFRRYDGEGDSTEYIRRFEIDRNQFNFDDLWAINNFDRFLDKSAKSWWTANYPLFLAELDDPEINAEITWGQIKRQFVEIFDHSSQKSSYKQKNRELIFKFGDDPQSYVTSKLEILRHLDPLMSEERRVEQLSRGLPYTLKQSFALQTIPTTHDFLSKLRRSSEVYAEEKHNKPTAEQTQAETKSYRTGNYYSVSSADLGKLERQAPSQNRPKGNQNRTSDGRVICDYCYMVGHTKKYCRNLARVQAQNQSSNSPPANNLQYQPRPSQPNIQQTPMLQPHRLGGLVHSQIPATNYVPVSLVPNAQNQPNTGN